MALTEQKKRFADRYFETLKGSESAIYAGYSEATARQIAHNLLQEPEVEAYLSELREEYAKKSNITKERWVAELAELGFSNIQDFIDIGNSIKDISSIERVRASAVASIKKTVTEGEFGVKEVTEFKLHDKLGALDKIGRHFDFFNADSSSKNTTTNIINLGSGTPPDAVTTETE